MRMQKRSARHWKQQISIFQLNPKQVGRKTKVCYPGYNRYDNETENFIERYLGKNG